MAADRPDDRPDTSGDPDVDAAFARIVAGFDQPADVDGGVPRWPVLEDLPDDEATARRRRADADDRGPDADDAGDGTAGAPDASDGDAAPGAGRGPATSGDRASDRRPVERPDDANPIGREHAPDAPEAAEPLRPRPLPGPAELSARDWIAMEPEEGYVPPEPPPLPRGDLVSRLAWAGVLLGPLVLVVAGLFFRDLGRLWLALAGLAFIGGFVTLVVRLPAHRDDDVDDDGAVV
ncbi:hypothetical protein [Angustibacter aerolatus]